MIPLLIAALVLHGSMAKTFATPATQAERESAIRENLRACKASGAGGCYFAGANALDPRTTNTPSLRGYFKEAYTDAHPDVCDTYGLLLARAGDLATAKEVLKATCGKDRVRGAGCFLMAEIMRREKNEAQANYFSGLACQYGDHNGCVVGQRMQLDKKFIERANRSKRARCTEKIKCGGLADAAEVESAKKIFQFLCDQGDGESCGLLADYVERTWAEDGHYLDEKFMSVSRPKGDPPKLAVLYERGCASGYTSACFSAGAASTVGSWGAKIDKNAAARWYGKGCDQGNAACCENLKRSRR